MENTYLELVGAILALTAVTLDTRQQVLARPMSLVSISVELFVYSRAGLYARCVLSTIYFLLNIYGWYQWKYGGKNQQGLKVSQVGTRSMIAFILFGLMSTFSLGYILQTQTNADLAYWDSANTAFCLIAQLLLVKKKLETWIFWFVLDSYFAVLCYHKELYIFSATHGVFLLLSLYGYRSWRQDYLGHLVETSSNHTN